MNSQVLRLCGVFRLSLSSKATFLSRQTCSPTIACQRFRNLGHDRRFVFKMSPRSVIESLSSVQAYCTKTTPEKKVKDHKENILTIPNVLTVARMAMCPVLGYLVIHNDYSTAFGLFLAAGITDLLDGWIARTFPSQSSLAGSFLDPMADKLLIGTLFISLTYSELIPLSLTALIIARDCLLVGAGFYVRYISLTPPRNLRRYFDASLVTAQLAPTNISKLNTAIQLLLVACSLAVPAFSLTDSILPPLWYVTGTTTVLSGLSYVFAKNTYRIISRPRAK